MHLRVADKTWMGEREEEIPPPTKTPRRRCPTPHLVSAFIPKRDPTFCFVASFLGLSWIPLVLVTMASAVQTAVQVQSALNSIGSPPVESATVKGEETDKWVTGVGSAWLIAAALIAIASAAVSMILTASVVVDVACVSIFLLAPIAIVQKQKLSKLGGLRSLQNDLRMSVNNFSNENNKLETTLSDMRTTVDDLKTEEQDWQALVQKSGGQSDRFVDIIRENASLQESIKRNLEAQVMQSVLNLVIQSDADGNFTLDQKELKRLQLNLSNIPGVTFDKANFEKLIGRDKPLKLSDIMNMFRNLKANIPEEENIFHISPKSLVSSSSSSSPRGLFGLGGTPK